MRDWLLSRHQGDQRAGFKEQGQSEQLTNTHSASSRRVVIELMAVCGWGNNASKGQTGPESAA